MTFLFGIIVGAGLAYFGICCVFSWALGLRPWHRDFWLGAKKNA